MLLCLSCRPPPQTSDTHRATGPSSRKQKDSKGQLQTPAHRNRSSLAPNSSYNYEAQSAGMKPILGKEPAAHSPLCSLLSQSPHRRWRDLNGCTCTTQTASPRARRRLRLLDADCVSSCTTQTASGALIQQQMAPGDELHQPISVRQPCCPAPTSSLSYPTCSRSRPQSADPLRSGWSSPLGLGVQGWPWVTFSGFFCRVLNLERL